MSETIKSLEHKIERLKRLIRARDSNSHQHQQYLKELLQQLRLAKVDTERQEENNERTSTSN
jgi:hypothetical protein